MILGKLAHQAAATMGWRKHLFFSWGCERRDVREGLEEVVGEPGAGLSISQKA